MKSGTLGNPLLLFVTGVLLAVTQFHRANAQTEGDLVLPDVNIVGRKRFEFVLMGEKTLRLHRFKLPAYRSVGAKKPAGPDLLLDISPKRAMPQKQWPGGKGLFSVRSQLGSFADLHLGARAGREQGRAGFALTVGDHTQTPGHTDDSASRCEAVEALMAYTLPDKGDLSLRIGVEEGETKLWGARPLPQQRRFRRWETRMAASLPMSENISATLGGRLSRDEIENRKTSIRAEETAVRGFGVLYAQQKETRLRLAATYEGGFLDQRTIESTSHLLGVEAGAERVFGAVSLSGGVRYFYADDPSEAAQHLFYPKASVTYTPNPRLEMALAFDPTAVSTTLWKRYQANPFLQLGTPSLPNRTERKPMALSLKFDTRLSETLSGAFRLGYENTEHFPVWTDADTNGTWEIMPDREVTHMEASIRMEYEAPPTLLLSSRLTIQRTSFSDTSDGRVPYTPSFTGRVEGSSEPYSGWGLFLSADVIGARFVEEGSDEKSDPYVLLTAQLTKEITAHLDAFLRADNLLDQSYALWKDYSMPGIGVSGGLKLAW